MLDNLQGRAEVFFPGLADEATSRARKQLQVNTILPRVLHSRSKEAGIVRQELVLCINPRATVANRESIR